MEVSMDKVGLAADEAAAALKRVLDLNAARQRVGARNLANFGSEGYRPKRVEFTDEMARALGKVEMTRTDPRHLDTSRATEGGEPHVEVVEDEEVDLAVELEATAAQLADAEIAYATAARLMAKRIATLKTAITGNP
jgi:flagellar basal-body rod protein FlgB